MPPVARCMSGCCIEPPNIAKCGTAPNKYCYRRDCYNLGVQRGHIRPNPNSSKRPAGGPSSSGVAPAAMDRDDDERPSFATATLYEILAIYGWRSAHSHTRPPPQHMMYVFACAHRAVDPTRMTERQRRNEVTPPDLYISPEFLVYGNFREDEEDEGYSATRWLPAGQLEGLEDRASKLEELEQLLTDVRREVFEDEL